MATFNLPNAADRTELRSLFAEQTGQYWQSVQLWNDENPDRQLTNDDLLELFKQSLRPDDAIMQNIPSLIYWGCMFYLTQYRMPIYAAFGALGTLLGINCYWLIKTNLLH